MDEKERDLLPENEQEKEEITADVNEQEAENSDLPADDLSKELNDLKDLFQQELDKASQESDEDKEDGESESTGELIQELSDFQDENEAEAAEEKEERICQRCGEAFSSSVDGEYSPYCDDCAAFVKKSPMRAIGFVTAIVMAVVFFVNAFTSISAFDESLFEAYIHRSNGNRLSAIDSGNQYLSVVGDKNASELAIRGLIEDYSKTGYVSDAVNLIKKYYSDTALNMPWNMKYKNYVEDAELHIKTYQAVTELISPLLSEEEFSYEEVKAKLDECRAATDENGDRIYSDMFIDLITVEVMLNAGISDEEQLEVLKKVQQENKNFEGLYLSLICSTALRANDLELLESCYEKMKKNNAQDMTGYIAYASYFRYLETPDPDKMIEICTEAASHAYTGDYSYKTTLAIAYLLKGEGSLALQEMDDFMATGRYSASNCNLYALAALYNGNEDIYESMKALLENYGYEISDLVEQYKAGKIEIAEVLTDKGGNIG